MKIVIISGSPKRTGMTQDLINIFKSQLENHKEKIGVTEINLTKNRLKMCRGVHRCFLSGDCPLNKSDDMDNILNEILSANGLIVVTPVYVHQVPGMFKNLIDRMAYMEHYFPLHHKYFSLLVHANSNGTEQVESYLEKIFTTMGAHFCNSLRHLSIHSGSDELEQRMSQNIDELVNSILKKTYTIHPLQNRLFEYMKSIVISEKKSGIVTYKQQGWETLSEFDNYSDFITRYNNKN